MRHPEAPKFPSAIPPATPALLTDQHAVVTGAGAGIGRGIARALAWHGAAVTVVDSDEASAREVCQQISDESDATPTPVCCDVTSQSDVEQLVQQVHQHATNGTSILVNNVGDWRPNGAFVDTTPADWQTLYALNLEHVFRVTSAFLPSMVERRRGSIINVSSVEGLRGIPNNAVYAACKAGVVNFTKSLAVETANVGVRVNGIAPDTTHTKQIPVHDWIDDRYADDIPKWMPLGRFARPDDHGDVAVFLASSLSRFVTGHTIPVDGGTMAAPGWYRRNDSLFTNQPRGLR